MARIKGMTYSKDKRRELILQAGLVTFCRMGYDGANIDDIAKESKCSHGLIYYYFKNKEEIFRELVRQSAELSEATAKQFEDAKDADPAELLYKSTEKLLVIIQTRQDVFYYFQFATMLNLLKKDLKELDLELPKYLPYDALRELFERGQNAGKIRGGNVDMLVNLYLSIIQGLTARKALSADLGQVFLLPTAEFIMDIFWNKEER